MGDGALKTGTKVQLDKCSEEQVESHSPRDPLKILCKELEVGSSKVLEVKERSVRMEMPRPQAANAHPVITSCNTRTSAVN